MSAYLQSCRARETMCRFRFLLQDLGIARQMQVHGGERETLVILSQSEPANIAHRRPRYLYLWCHCLTPTNNKAPRALVGRARNMQTSPAVGLPPLLLLTACHSLSPVHNNNKVPGELVGRAGHAGDALGGGAGAQGCRPRGREEGRGARAGRQGPFEDGHSERGGR